MFKLVRPLPFITMRGEADRNTVITLIIAIFGQGLQCANSSTTQVGELSTRPSNRLYTRQVKRKGENYFYNF